MSKRLKLAGPSVSRALRSSQTLVNEDEKTSPYFTSEKKLAKTGVKKCAPIKIERETTDDKTNVKETNITPIVIKREDAKVSTNIKTEEREIKKENVEQSTEPRMNIKDEERWMPPNWETILKNIKEMRKHATAPVDTMGCHKCADPDASPVVSRYQSLIALMLSSQTKDQVTHAAMQRLNTYGCKPDIITATPDDVLGKLIYPVGFWKVKTRAYLFIIYNTFLESNLFYLKFFYAKVE